MIVKLIDLAEKELNFYGSCTPKDFKDGNFKEGLNRLKESREVL